GILILRRAELYEAKSAGRDVVRAYRAREAHNLARRRLSKRRRARRASGAASAADGRQRQITRVELGLAMGFGRHFARQLEGGPDGDQCVAQLTDHRLVV